MARDTTGDRAAWRELFEAEYPRLGGWVRQLVDDDDTAHEIASEAFTRLMSRWSRADDPRAYLYKVATNLVRDQWRRTGRERRSLRLLAAGHGRESDRQPDLPFDLRALLESLPGHQRAAVMLHHLAGFTVHEVSLVVGRPEGTVKSDLYQARQKLRSALDMSHD